MAENNTPTPLTPEQEVIAAERQFMRAQSRYVNTFNPNDELSQAMDAAAKIVNGLYEKYPQFKPQPKT